MSLQGAELEYWESYVETLDLKPESLSVISEMAGNAQLADDLLKLYLGEKKTAGSGLLRDYQVQNEEIPKVGDYWIILDRNSNPRCIVRTVKVEINKFSEVPESVAIAEGEGDLSIDYWRKAHREFFSPFLEDLEIDELDQALVITEHFELVYS